MRAKTTSSYQPTPPRLLDDVPFRQRDELCKELVLTPSTRAHGSPEVLQSLNPERPWLPGRPAVPLSSAALGYGTAGAKDPIVAQLQRDLLTPRLDRFHPWLFLVATPSSAHVSPLHEQLVRGRAIIITEDPEMHLVWAGDRVFIKPLPPYLLSHAFWRAYLTPGPKKASTCETPFFNSGSQGPDDHVRIVRAALGYMRTWFYLVRYESDFRLAQEHHLIPHVLPLSSVPPSSGASSAPPSPEASSISPSSADHQRPLDFATFLRFITAFSPEEGPAHLSPNHPQITDDLVSKRYRFGQLRLTRLNLWAFAALRSWQFHKLSWQYADFFARFYAPLLFAFAVVSIVLSAFQLGTQVHVRAEDGDDTGTWAGWDGVAFDRVAAVVAVGSLVGVGLVAGGLLGLLALMLGRELVFVLGHTNNKNSKAGEKSGED